MPARRSIEQISAITAQIIFAYFILFQLLVIVGIVPVSLLWGGTHVELTWQLRFASLFGALVLAGFARVIYKRACLRMEEGWGFGFAAFGLFCFSR